MPFTLTFDSNQETSARKYFARTNPPMPVEPIVNACPQVKAPKCESGQRLDVTYGAAPCRTPNYKCVNLPTTSNDPLEFCRTSLDERRCATWWAKNGCTVRGAGAGTLSVQCPSRPAVEPLTCPQPMPPLCAPNQVLQSQGVVTMADGCKIPTYACVMRPSPPVTGIYNEGGYQSWPNIIGNQGGLILGSNATFNLKDGGLQYLPSR